MASKKDAAGKKPSNILEVSGLTLDLGNRAVEGGNGIHLSRFGNSKKATLRLMQVASWVNKRQNKAADFGAQPAAFSFSGAFPFSFGFLLPPLSWRLSVT
ncbi:MAG: hypothetical protein ACE5I2_09755 [Anaerolineae bacterium]